MPGFPFPGRPGGEHDEPLLDIIVDRRPLPPGTPVQTHDLAVLLTALAGPAEPGELAGEAAARAAFTRVTSPARISSATRRPTRRRRSARPARGRTQSARGRTQSARGRTRLAAVLVAAAAALAPALP